MSEPSDVNKFFTELSGLAADMEDLRKRNEQLQQEVNYWKIEATHDHDRWNRCLEDMDKMTKEQATFRAEVKKLMELGFDMAGHLPDTDPANDMYWMYQQQYKRILDNHKL